MGPTLTSRCVLAETMHSHMLQDISEAQHLILGIITDVWRGRPAVVLVQGCEGHRGEVGRGARVWAGRAPAVRHLHEATD